MPCTYAEEKQEIITKYATHEGDTGSPEVQVALLSKRIADLTEHLKEHKHDHHSVVVCCSWSVTVVVCLITSSASTSTVTVP